MQMRVDSVVVNHVLEELRGAVGADAVFLVDVGGFLLAGTPTGEKFDLEGMASLSAGNYLSGMELAKLLRIDDFQSFFLGSGKKVDYLQIGGEGIFLAVLHPRKASLAEAVDRTSHALERIQAMYAKAAREAGASDVVVSDRRMFTATPLHFPTIISGESDSAELNRCSFCGKDASHVSKLVKGPRAMICDECIKLMAEVLFVDLL